MMYFVFGRSNRKGHVVEQALEVFLPGEDEEIRFIFDPAQVAASAALLLQWAVSKLAVDKFAHGGVSRPYLFLVVTDPKGIEERSVIDLKKLETLIQFHRPGVHRIRGILVYKDNEQAADVWVKRESRREYNTPLEDFTRYRPGSASTDLSVEVSDDFFAKPLSPWEDWWINLWFEDPPWDECEISRRKWLAYTVQALAICLLWIPFISIIRGFYALWLVLSASRGIRWSAIWHPFTYSTRQVRVGFEDPDYVLGQDGFGRFLTHDSRGRRRRFSQALWTFTPVVQFQLLLATAEVYLQLGGSHFFVWYACTVVAFAVAWQGLAGGLLPIIERHGDAQSRRKAANRKARIEEGVRSGLARSLLVPVPPTGLRPVQFMSLESAYRHLKLRWCRPTARR